MKLEVNTAARQVAPTFSTVGDVASPGGTPSPGPSAEEQMAEARAEYRADQEPV